MPKLLIAVTCACALLAGCAQDLVPPAAPDGPPCETLDDCAPTDMPVCGSLRACVDGVCEASASIFRPCPE